MTLTEADRVAVNITCGDPAPPSPLNGAVHIDDNTTIRHELFDHNAE